MKHLLLALLLAANLQAHPHPECECECPCCADPPSEVLPAGDVLDVKPPPHAGNGDWYGIEGWDSYKLTIGDVPAGATEVWVSVKEPQSTEIGTVALFGGGAGTEYWTGGSSTKESWADGLAATGYRVVQVRHSDGWRFAPEGQDLGMAALAATSATVIEWIAETWVGEGMPFIASGQSAGSGEVAYSLAYYGSDQHLTRAVLSGGPPWVRLDLACQLIPPFTGMNSNNLRYIDESYGIYGGGGPAETNDPAFAPRWEEDAIGVGGLDYNYTTEIRLVFGNNDSKQRPGYEFYRDLLLGEGNDLTYVELPGVGHKVTDSTSGLAAILTAITE